MLRKIVFTTAALLSISLPAVASQFVKIADDADGAPMLIDTKSFEGNTFKVYQRQNGQIAETKFEVSCPEGRVWKVEEIFGGDSKELRFERKITPMPNSADTPSGTGLRFFCRAFRVPGY